MCFCGQISPSYLVAHMLPLIIIIITTLRLGAHRKQLHLQLFCPKNETAAILWRRAHWKLVFLATEKFVPCHKQRATKQLQNCRTVLKPIGRSVCARTWDRTVVRPKRASCLSAPFLRPTAAYFVDCLYNSFITQCAMSSEIWKWDKTVANATLSCARLA